MRVVRPALLATTGIVSAYLVLWGVTWLTGDLSTFGAGVTATGEPFTIYPGVLFGGLPPQPGFESAWPTLFAIVLGALGLIGLVIVALRRRPR